MDDTSAAHSERAFRLAVAFAREAATSPPARLCRACRDVLDVTGTGLTLMAGVRSGPLCSTSAAVRALDEVQFTAGEGPCRDAFVSRRSVHAPHLDDAAAARWPSFVEAARRSGIGGVFAYPLERNGARVGVMTLYQQMPGQLSAQQDEDSIAVAEVIAETVLSLQAQAQPGELGHGLDGAESYRAEIHQAAGMLAVQFGIPVSDAMARLRARALATDAPLSQLALGIVTRTIAIDADGDPTVGFERSDDA